MFFLPLRAVELSRLDDGLGLANPQPAELHQDRPAGSDQVQERNELFILCGYIGALLAIGRQNSSIVPALYEYTSC